MPRAARPRPKSKASSAPAPAATTPAADVATVTVTYYLEIMSSWCHWAEPAWRELNERFAGRVNFEWRIALMNPGDFPLSTAQCDWFYQRSGTHVRSPYMLDSGWLEPERAGHYEAPNLVAEAARDLVKPGTSPDAVRLALSTAALREGQKIGNLTTAVRIAAKAGGLTPAALRNATQSPDVLERVATSTAAFHAMGVAQRPTFVVENTIGDRAVLSGTWQAAPIAAAIEAMLADAAAYASHAAHHPPTPSA